jgi:2-polyprenyl-3-methyl-5-hydroxy-6-metoxy-1,4-benzoquinol methylase
VSEPDYSERVYAHYVETGYGRVHAFDAREYELYARFFRRNYARHLPQGRDARILDLGCGPGHFLYFLKDAGYRNYLGLDASDECIDICRQNGLNAERGDMFAHLPAHAAEYDAIVCNELFEHLPKGQAFALADLCRGALRPGGTLLVKVPNMACPVGSSRSRYVDITHETGYTDHSLRTLLETCGLANCRVLGPDIYVTRNPLANLAGRLFFRATACWFRVLELGYGIKTPHVMTKSILAVARRSPEDP